MDHLALPGKANQGQARWLNATLAVLFLGAALRLILYLNPVNIFGMDEAIWAMKLIHSPNRFFLIRSFGFVQLTRVITYFGQNELTYRFFPLMGGLLAPWFMHLLCRRFGLKSAASLIAVTMISLSFWAIQYSAEYKAYSFELAVHLALAAFALRLNPRSSRLEYLRITTAVLLAIPFAYNAVFFLPGLLAYFYFNATEDLRLRRFIMRLTGVLAAVACVILFLLPRFHDFSKTTEFWGEKYGVFFFGTGIVNYLGWLSTKWLEFAGNFLFWHKADQYLPVTLLSILGLCLAAYGTFGLLRRAPGKAALFFGPLLVASFANYLGYWAAGAFRVNLFLLGYFVVLVAAGLDSVFEAKTPRKVGLWLGRVSFALLLLKASSPYLRNPTALWSKRINVLPTLETLDYLMTTEEKTPIISNEWIFSQLAFYAGHHSHYSQTYRRLLPRLWNTFSDGPYSRRAANYTRHVIYLTDLNKGAEKNVQSLLSRGVRVESFETFSIRGTPSWQVFRLELPEIGNLGTPEKIGNG